MLCEQSLLDFYKEEYRDLYMGEENEDMDIYFNNMVKRGTYIKELFVKKHSIKRLEGVKILE